MCSPDSKRIATNQTPFPSVAVMGAIIVFLGAATAAPSVASAASACSPFGDAPAQTYDHAVSTAPTCAGGALLGASSDPWSDSDHNPRYACEWTPSSTPSGSLPLIVYLHPSEDTADSAKNFTNLLDEINTANVSGDTSRPGFFLLAPQGRWTHHWYGTDPNATTGIDLKSTGWDNWYRQVSPAGDVTVNGVLYKENVDAASIDHFIAEVVATGKIDTNRIYVTGWSNGAAMAYLYGLNRPGVAAVAVYSAPDPLAAFDDPCEQTPVAGVASSFSQLQLLSPRTPTYQIHNACDISSLCPNGLRMEGRLGADGTPVTDVIIDGNQGQVHACNDSCGTDPNGTSAGDAALNPLWIAAGTLDHSRWPKQWTDAIYAFFRQHALNSR
jgi:poly(3-hydroxybutyrate) depolymerase